MAYTALFQGHPVRFAAPVQGAVSCTPDLDDVLCVLEAIGVDPVALVAARSKAATAGALEFSALIQWLEGLHGKGAADVSMFLHWLLRHMPNAQVALGLPLLGYLLLPPAASRSAARSVKRRAAA